MADVIETNANAVECFDRADSVEASRNALYRLLGCASRHAREAEQRHDAAEARRAQAAVAEGAERDLTELRKQSTRSDGAERVYREDGAPITPTGGELEQARIANRWRTDVDDKTRGELVIASATRLAEMRAHAERKLADGPKPQHAQRADTSKADVAREKLSEAARAVQAAAELFAAVGDATDATRIKAIATELAALAKAASRTDSRGTRPLPNSRLKGSPP